MVPVPRALQQQGLSHGQTFEIQMNCAEARASSARMPPCATTSFSVRGAATTLRMCGQIFSVKPQRENCSRSPRLKAQPSASSCLSCMPTVVVKEVGARHWIALGAVISNLPFACVSGIAIIGKVIPGASCLIPLFGF